MACVPYLSLLSLSLYANTEKSLEHIEVLGTRAPMYDARDVNAAALGIKDPLQLPISIQSFSEQLIDNQLARTLSEVLSNDASLKGLSGLSANIGVFYVGERQQNLQNSLSLPSYTRVDTGVRYDFSDLNLMLRFKVENLFDKEYWVSAGAKGMDWGVAPGNGRLVSLSANYTF
ncbi:Vitamin B12 transporter BtuB [Pseudoalteromonas sp. P1-9]|uniref:TonB-dependent receptor n=1 Tax=Pseudoalteromonas sp. P1-9 TaxID=1710354 RepID=UPI0006D60901|nr:TonB-dependent receptor [Pseudoalteromonas sp. P1-9]KPV93808.1 Vitamin B12 transporter BtuB [Pseudoalteromonas sp. P1-9]